MSFRLRPKFTGLFHDESVTDSFWIRETGRLSLPSLAGIDRLTVVGEVLPARAESAAQGPLGLNISLDGQLASAHPVLPEGLFRLTVPLRADHPATGHELTLHLCGVGGGNFLAWLARLTGLGFLQPWRRQPRNRRLRIQRIEAGDEVLFDFANRTAPWNGAFARRFLRVGLNIAGFFRADLGVGESVRCMARAADAAGLPAALVNLKLNCINPQTDATFADRLQEANPYPVNVFHLDAPVSGDIDHHHGAGFRKGKYNIAYWAWELPEFPDAWVHHANHFDEIWTPSRFTTEAIAQKVPLPVLTMPHAIGFARPQGDFRRKYGLPEDKFLFLFLYDLNSYSERKNPAAVLEAFRRSGLAGRGAALVIKVHNVPTNPADFARLREAVAALPGTTLITQTLARAEVYELESACDCFVSLHRAEGFGLALAECMHLGKPVIATDWSGTTDFIRPDNACPVRCVPVTLDRTHGPYTKGQTWAEPDIDHAAWWMQQLHTDPALVRRTGLAARTSIETTLAPAVIGARYRRRLEVIAGW
ncbi:Glycosyl transferases group 1 [Lacunisphaera limnophila]|uniref:Glycosyl transferases group 1 n=1 Tax=Lacunisphaera limnophila TaxID=1838286 RepID=A0A1D8AVK3_9BACT|nr:glycosyltransferase [Lacunisphaera limnophila]AOS44930.1 Glycosyl transferases group 1 [Lacunisphaera limnophila]